MLTDADGCGRMQAAEERAKQQLRMLTYADVCCDGCGRMQAAEERAKQQLRMLTYADIC